MKKQIYPTCYKYPEIFRCEFGAECNIVGKPGYCTADHIKTMDPNHVRILREDCIAEGYTCTGIEAELLFLNQNFDTDVDGVGKNKGSFLHQMRNETIVPFPGAMQIGPFFHLRASEFGGRCSVAKLISKVRENFKALFLDTDAGIAGNTRHAICNTQPEGEEFIHNRTLEKINCPSQRREGYCEQSMEYTMPIGDREIIFRGHSDGVLRWGEHIAILDFKRILGGAYESPKIRHQLMIYALAREQYENRLRLRAGEPVTRRDPFLLISVKRPFPAALEGKQRRPKFHITKIDRAEADDFLRGLREIVVVSYLEQKELLEEQEYIPGYIEEQRKKKVCRVGEENQCFSYPICEKLLDLLSSGTDLSDLLAPEVRFDKRVEDSEAREIEERIQRKV